MAERALVLEVRQASPLARWDVEADLRLSSSAAPALLYSPAAGTDAPVVPVPVSVEQGALLLPGEALQTQGGLSALRSPGAAQTAPDSSACCCATG